MNESQVRSLALFFFFTLLDENLAERAALQGVKRIKHLMTKNKNQVEFDVNALVVHVAISIFNKMKGREAFNKAHVGAKSKFILPKGFSLGAWRHFYKETDIDDVIAVIWSRILGFSDLQIARGLGVPVGTIRHRVGRGLRQLGLLLTLGEAGA